MSSLKRPVLVLNKVWIPIRVITVKRALKLLFADRASTILADDYSVYNWAAWAAKDAKDDEPGIQTAYRRIRVPEVIVLLRYDKVHRKNIRLTKKNIYIRDRYKCQYTGKQMSHKDADIDHVVPRSHGGKNSWDNLVVCSRAINREKGDRTPEEAGLKLIKKPTKPNSDQILIDPKMDIPSSWEKFITPNK